MSFPRRDRAPVCDIGQAGASAVQRARAHHPLLAQARRLGEVPVVADDEDSAGERPHGTFDDMPEKYWENVNTSIPPYNRRKGDPPALDDREIDAVVAFLNTLTDLRLPFVQ